MKQGQLPFDEVETRCLVCGKIIVRPKKRRGRHSRFCSVECKNTRSLVWLRRWRIKRHQGWVGGESLGPDGMDRSMSKRVSPRK